jgi:nucleotide-binding universal stress UspA family protein
MTVLAAYDPQTLDRAPVRFAATAARFANVPLVIASVRAGLTPERCVSDGLVGEGLEPLRTDLETDYGIDVRTRVVRASTPMGVARALQRVIDAEHTSLAVVGSTTRGVVGRVAPGTTAQRVINGCACPVVVVPHGQHPPPRLSVIGVGFVPTPEGHRALRAAAAVAQMAGAELRVVTVVKPGLGTDASAGPTRDTVERSRAHVEATLTDAIAELTHDVKADGEVMVDDPADALLSVSSNVDLLVMGSRGYGPSLAVLLGGVSRRLTMAARCPVLVMPRGSTSALADWAETATACETYSSEVAARRAVRALTAVGVPEGDVRLLVGRPVRDIREEVVGGFAGALDPRAPVGTYMGAPCRRRQGAGSFAGDPDRQRQGSFADADTDAIATLEDGAGRSHPASRAIVRRLLWRSALAGAAADRVIDELRAGHAVVLVDAGEIAASDARARLEELAHAA